MIYRIYSNFQGWNLIAKTSKIEKVFETLEESLETNGNSTHIVIEQTKEYDFPLFTIHDKEELERIKEERNESGKMYAKRKL